ncbi:hypothetical protein [Nostoc sp. C117]|uniref:hypothetical protein n=1 Tax=Nostoc sp. C117 TaxID=3349875 RepID=UPI00370DD76E
MSSEAEDWLWLFLHKLQFSPESFPSLPAYEQSELDYSFWIESSVLDANAISE